MSLQEFWAYLKDSLSGSGIIDDALSAEELSAVERLKTEKYDTWEWTYGRSPKYNITNKRRYPAGSIEFRAQVEGGIIREISFYGDFLSVCPIDPLTQALTNCRFCTEDVKTALDRLDLKAILGSITEDELLDLMFLI